MIVPNRKSPHHTKKGPGRYHPAPAWLTEQRRAARRAAKTSGK